MLLKKNLLNMISFGVYHYLKVKLQRFLDFQNDVAVSDIEIALREGYRSIEHVRYTTLGMATDQGKTSNLNGLQLVSEIENRVVPSVGHTTQTTLYTSIYRCNCRKRW